MRFFSLLLFFAIVGVGGVFAIAQYNKKRIGDERYYIRTIVQTGLEKQPLKSAYLAELLDLSVNRPISLYAFDCKKARERLLLSPLIKSAKVKRARPDAVYVDYEVRKPIAMLADYTNTAIDWEGCLFPFSPFFAPKEIPEIYLGLPPFEAPEDGMGRGGGRWLTPMQNPFLTLALDVLKLLEDSAWKEHFKVKKIDVSNAFAASLGQREIVLFTEEELFFRKGEQEVCCIFPKILRMAPKDFAQQLNCFYALRRNMEEDYRKQLEERGEADCHRFASRIIDLRIPQLAFVQIQELN